jgi:hypothetical protein
MIARIETLQRLEKSSKIVTGISCRVPTSHLRITLRQKRAGCGNSSPPRWVFLDLQRQIAYTHIPDRVPSLRTACGRANSQPL